MKISHLNRLTTGTLLLVVTIMTLVLAWSLDRLDSSFSKARSYHQLQSEINSGINRPILAYLATGDATLVRGSWFVVRGSWFVVRGSWFV
ncbi:MAG: hypothetical protein V7731_23765, partial [Amphritea sp.]